MKIYFTWNDLTSEVESIQSLISDLTVITLIIYQREGEVATAHVTVPVLESIKLGKTGCIFFENTSISDPLFRWTVIGVVNQNEHVKTIEMLACPGDAAEQLQRLLDQGKQSDCWNPLFVNEVDHNNPAEILEAQTKIFYWDRIQHAVSLSSYFEGSQEVDLSHCFLQESLKLSQVDTPLPSIDVEVVAEWVQEADGEVDLFPLIAAHFKEGKLNTLTPHSLERHWPKPGHSLKRSGYTIMASWLEEKQPPSTGELNLYPTFVTIMRGGQPYHYRRTWYDGELLLSWHYRQRRRETVKFTLNHDHQLKSSQGRPKKLKLNLQAIDSLLPKRSATTFFQTEAGIRAINHALKIAECHLAASARAYEVEFVIPLEEAIGIDLDTSVILKHASLPQGMIKGKVIAYRFISDATHRLAWIRLAVSVGVGEKLVHPVEDEKNLISVHPMVGLVEPDNLPPSGFLEHLHVQGSVQDHVEALESNQECIEPTRIHFRLKDLKTHDVLEAVYTLDEVRAWSAPQHVNLTGDCSNEI